MNWPIRTALFCLLGISQCTSGGVSRVQPEEMAPPYSPPALAPVEPSEHEVQRRQCEATLRETLAMPAVPGAPDYAKRRLEILTRAKAEPAVLTHTPQLSEADPKDLVVTGYRQLLEQTEYPWDALENMLPTFKKKPQIGRQVLLRDGYLYADDPELAYALVGLVSAEHLFGHDRIWIRRGENLYHAKRKKGRYYFTDGPSEGELARLLLFDQIGHGATPADTILRDFRALKYRLHFTQAEVRHVAETRIVANLRYGSMWVPSVLTSNGAHLALQCEIVAEHLVDQLENEKREAERRQNVVQVLRHSMQLQIEDQLPFDEPRREFGFQLDGKLRRNWLYAYLNDRRSYAFNGDRYFVFNSKGQPLIPQVCVDFLTDTLERASGTWWKPKSEGRARIVGKLDYEPMNLLERAKLRRVPGFLLHARSHPEQFEVLDVPEKERVPLGERKRYIDYLLTHRDDFQGGDILMIRGPVPWDPIELHYHSFFVYETDPLSGIPLAVVGNAGRPSVRYWEVEARRTPQRAIWHRVRPKTEWLESIVVPLESSTNFPPPISPRGNAG